MNNPAGTQQRMNINAHRRATKSARRRLAKIARLSRRINRRRS